MRKITLILLLLVMGHSAFAIAGRDDVPAPYDYGRTAKMSGDVKPGCVRWQLIQDYLGWAISVTSGNNTNIYGGLQQCSADSVIIDSLFTVTNTSHNDAYCDTIALCKGYTRGGNEMATIIWGDGTNIGSGDTDYHVTSYTSGFPVTVSTDWRLRWYTAAATTGSAGNVYISNITIYGHYK